MNLNNPIGYKSLEPLQKPFIINPFRFAGITPTFEDDFSSYATQGAADAVWSTTSSYGVVNITGDYLYLNVIYSGSNISVYHTLTAPLSNTIWLSRFSWLPTITTNPPGNWEQLGFTISSTTGNFNTVQDALGFNPICTSDGHTFIRVTRADNGNLDSSLGTGFTTEMQPAGTTLYYEVKRLTATMEYQAYDYYF